MEVPLNLENVDGEILKSGSKCYPKGAAGASVFNLFLIRLFPKLTYPDTSIPERIMVVTKTWLQTINDEEAHALLSNLAIPRDYSKCTTNSRQVIFKVDLESPITKSLAWFAVEDHLFKKRTSEKFESL
ncbi:hypothetical protein AQUCO_00400786v1 [Aquilegia coerulea]|uniref:Uncharacterized protein n=1 Tax=Aquilegia coerulea TaxID=218851 RepID=A0A2G5EWM8_AQUCA|nr:hypothetical protein AQUCO_00400786v1 [Aquilegia coerulea]